MDRASDYGLSSAVDGQQEMWVRDRVAATEATLDPVQYGLGRAVEFGERGL